MREQRTISRQETRRMVSDNLDRHMAEMYPNMPRRVRRQLVAKATRKAMTNAHGAKVVVTKQPANMWQRMKAAVGLQCKYVER